MKGFQAEITDISEISQAIRKITEQIPRQDMERVRIDHLDIARGLAIVLMFLSHTVMALNTYATLPEFALMPVHTITKFSSTLFILTFGMSLSLFYLPSYQTEKWPLRRRRLLWRAINILIWYKILTYVQMFQHYPEKEVTDALLFRRFTDFAEVLNFYWLAILWIVPIIPIWVRINHIARLLLTIAFVVAGTLLNQHFDFWGIWQLKAVLVEHENAYCFGQFQRGALVLFGMFLVGICIRDPKRPVVGLKILGIVSLVIGITFFAYFLHITSESEELRRDVLIAISKNFGKHPPNVHFSVFSLGGAFSIMGLVLLLPSLIMPIFKPITIIGKEAFFCFNWHLILIFVVYRYFWDLRLQLSYAQTMLALGGVVATSLLLAPVNTWIKKQGVFWKWLLP